MNKIFKLDTKDMKILAELDRNARQSNSQIGKKVRLSKEVVNYRINKMIEDEVIIRFHTVINYFKVNIVKFKLYLRLTNFNKDKLIEIAEYFNEHTKTEWVALTTGRWDLIVGFLVKNINEFDDELQIIFNKFFEHIQEKAVTATLYLAHQPRLFLNSLKNQNFNIVYHTTKDKEEQIDDLDLQILKLITNNARMSVIDIANFIKTTARIVQYRIKQLERKKIILGYKVHLNPQKMNKIFCKAFFYLNVTNKNKIEEFINYSSLLHGAIWPQKILGSWDFEIDFELDNYDTFQNIILQLKENFSEIIKNYEFCIAYREFKLDLFPEAHKTI